MNLVTGSFDTVLAIRELGRRVEELESRLAAMEAAGRPSATMDAGGQGATMETEPATNKGSNKRMPKGKTSA